MANDNHHIFIIDDEQKVCNLLFKTLIQYEINATCFTRGKDCLKELKSQRCDLLITALKTPEIDGIELMKKAHYLVPYLPIIIITGYGDIPTAVSAIKAGAVDFIEKPFKTGTFINKIQSILKQNSNINKIYKPLTNMEMKVLKLIFDGRTNHDIANIMKRSVRTIEVHRANIMEKLGVNNVVDLIKRATLIGHNELSDYKTNADNVDEKQKLKG